MQSASGAAMAQEDFDIDRLAAYLHIMPAAVLKLAERGKIPGRRVGGGSRMKRRAAPTRQRPVAR